MSEAMVLSIVTAVGGFAILMGGWFLVQAFYRKRPGEDALSHVSHGCGACPQEGSCGTAQSCPSESTRRQNHVSE